MDQSLNKLSKFLSYVLRHKPEEIGIELSEEGWTDTNQLIQNAVMHGVKLDLKTLEKIVETSDKKRFTFSCDKSQIRAAQGHSTQQVNINYPEAIPPEVLYHGTATRFLESIKEQGLISGSRQYVHLSQNQQTAQEVGQRYGKSVLLTIDAKAMHESGYIFYLAENNVWLTKHVPSHFLITKNV